MFSLKVGPDDDHHDGDRAHLRHGITSPYAMVPIDSSLPRYLSLAEAGAVASFSERTLRRAIAAGKLRAHHVGRNVRIELAELRRWIEAGGAAGDLPDSDASRKDRSR